MVRPNKFTVTTRGNRGREIIRAGYLVRASTPIVELKFHDDGSEPGSGEPDEPLDAPPETGQEELF